MTSCPWMIHELLERSDKMSLEILVESPAPTDYLVSVFWGDPKIFGSDLTCAPICGVFVDPCTNSFILHGFWPYRTI